MTSEGGRLSIGARRDRLFGRFEAAARFVRIFSMGATVTYPLIGSATGSDQVSLVRTLGIVALGVVAHNHAAVLNDVMDYPIDRTDPRRAESPLVQGSVSRGAALAFSLANLALAAGCMIALDASGEAWLAWALSLTLVATYNLIGKRIRWAVLSDVAQGVGTACFVWVGAALTGGATVATVAAMAYVAGYVVMVNGVHGTVRDLTNDARHGAKTTAIAFGASVDERGGAVLPGTLVAWAVLLQIWLLGAAAALIVLGDFSARTRLGAILAGGVVAAAGVRVGLASLAARSDRSEMMAFGTWHLFYALALPVAIAAWLMPWWMVAITLVVFVLPPKVFGWAVAEGANRGQS